MRPHPGLQRDAETPMRIQGKNLQRWARRRLAHSGAPTAAAPPPLHGGAYPGLAERQNITAGQDGPSGVTFFIPYGFLPFEWPLFQFSQPCPNQAYCAPIRSGPRVLPPDESAHFHNATIPSSRAKVPGFACQQRKPLLPLAVNGHSHRALVSVPGQPCQVCRRNRVFRTL